MQFKYSLKITLFQKVFLFLHINTDRSDKRHRNRKVYRVDYFKTYKHERFKTFHSK